MIKKTLVLNFSPFTATTDDIVVTQKYFLDSFSLAFQGDMTAAASVSWTSLLALVDPFEVKLDAVPIISINAEDLYALNNLWLGKRPIA